MRALPEPLVFIHQTALKTNLTRLRGSVPRGQRMQMTVPFGNSGTQTFIAGLMAETLSAL